MVSSVGNAQTLGVLTLAALATAVTVLAAAAGVRRKHAWRLLFLRWAGAAGIVATVLVVAAFAEGIRTYLVIAAGGVIALERATWRFFRKPLERAEQREREKQRRNGANQPG